MSREMMKLYILMKYIHLLEWVDMYILVCRIPALCDIANELSWILSTKYRQAKKDGGIQPPSVC